MADKSILGGVRPLHFPFIGTLNSQDSDTIRSSDARILQQDSMNLLFCYKLSLETSKVGLVVGVA